MLEVCEAEMAMDDWRLTRHEGSQRRQWQAVKDGTKDAEEVADQPRPQQSGDSADYQPQILLWWLTTTDEITIWGRRPSPPGVDDLYMLLGKDRYYQVLTEQRMAKRT